RDREDQQQGGRPDGRSRQDLQRPTGPAGRQDHRRRHGARRLMDGADLAPREFLGVGWAWPVEATGDGDIALARYEESVRQSVWIILGTSPGERVMRPD